MMGDERLSESVLVARNRALADEVLHLSGRLEAMRARIEELEAQATERQKWLDAATGEVERLRGEEARLRGELEALRARLDAQREGPPPAGGAERGRLFVGWIRRILLRGQGL